MDAQLELKTLLTMKAGIVWLRTEEPYRAKGILSEIMSSFKSEDIRTWTISRGLRDKQDTCLLQAPNGKPVTDPRAFLDFLYEDVFSAQKVETQEGKILYVIEDFIKITEDFITVRKLKDIIEILYRTPLDKARYVVIIDANPALKLPGLVEVELPLPDEKIVSKAVDDAIKVFYEQSQNAFTWSEEDRKIRKGFADDLTTNKETVVRSLLGLPVNGVVLALKRSFSIHKGLNIQELINSKKNFISSYGALTWAEPDPRGLEGVGGLNELKNWLLPRKNAYSKEAREYGLPLPKGMLVFGPPGTGKSLTAKCVATAWNLPLVKLSVGDLFDKYIGETEKNVKNVLSVLERISPCCLLLDEIEKAFSGVSNSGGTDGGTSTRMFGSFLSWLQENEKGTFVIATANDISNLPPELLRKGRFDELWFVDIPSKTELVEIIRVMKGKYPRTKDVNELALVEHATGLTGAEVESAFVSAMNVAFNNNKRNPNTDDIVAALKTIVPIMKTFSNKQESIEKFKTLSRIANTVNETTDKTKQGNTLIDTMLL